MLIISVKNLRSQILFAKVFSKKDKTKILEVAVLAPKYIMRWGNDTLDVGEIKVYSQMHNKRSVPKRFYKIRIKPFKQ